MRYRQPNITENALAEAGYRRFRSGEPNVDALFQKPMTDDAGKALFYMNFRLFDFSQFGGRGELSPGFDVSFDGTCRIHMTKGFLDVSVHIEEDMTIADVERIAMNVFNGVDHVSEWRIREGGHPVAATDMVEGGGK